MHALGHLISERMELNGWSLPQVVKRAEAQGARLGKSNLGKLKNKMTPSISRETVEGLAAGLGVTRLTVANAVLQSWSIEPRPVEVTDSIETIGIDPTLDERQRAELGALIREMRNRSAGWTVPVFTDEPDNLRGTPPGWRLPGKPPRVLGNEDGEQRDERGG